MKLFKKVLLIVLVCLLIIYLAVSGIIYFKYYQNIKDPYSFFEGEKVVIEFYPKDIKDIIDFDKYDTDYMKYSAYTPRSQKYKSVLDEGLNNRKFTL
mgnify:CR=1 FL=1